MAAFMLVVILLVSYQPTLQLTQSWHTMREGWSIPRNAITDGEVGGSLLYVCKTIVRLTEQTITGHYEAVNGHASKCRCSFRDVVYSNDIFEALCDGECETI